MKTEETTSEYVPPLTKLGGRRFLLCLGCSAVCSWLLWEGSLSDESFRWIILGTVAAYVTGGTTQKVSDLVTGRAHGN